MASTFEDRLEKIVEEFDDGNKSKFARRLKMSPQTFNNYVQGNRKPGWDVIKRFLSAGVNLNYLAAGIPPIKSSDIKEAGVSKMTVEDSSLAKELSEEYDHTQGNDVFSAVDWGDLSDAESQILEEVKQFSAFLESRQTLRPQAKRLLVQLLIQSIDQAIAQRQPDPDDS